MQYYQNIPRICTALAEWGACMVYLYLIKKEKFRRPSFWIGSLVVLAVQIAFLEFTGDFPVTFWIPCMLIAAAIMYGFLLLYGELTALTAVYCFARAFLLAEFAASLEWQVFAFLQSMGYGYWWMQWILTLVLYGACFWSTVRLERSTLTFDYLRQLTVREVLAAFGIAVAIFAFSNLSFLYNHLPFTSTHMADVFSIRTLVDFGGIAVLFAYQSRICDYMAERELTAMNTVLKSQYDQYRNYQDSLDMIHVKYHDLKHQIAGLRMETDEEKRRKWLDAMEEELSVFESMNKTGNQVLDTILAAKLFHCRKNQIQMTCVADGKLLDFMHVTDICSIFGNALDNAIEHVVLIREPEKRLIHISVSAKRNFVFIKIENYCETEIRKNEESLINTTKADKQNHGFGLRSIVMTAEKYGGSVDFDQNHGWFELKILLPRG
ncbi:MAG: ATP-binding protein [Lachnospiraceae bacterium]|nr:ATP-binding protein [Lachnospiraceae bacterium]